MDCGKVGKLLYELRKEKRMTQRQLAERMNISDKAISKWERGLGCPDVSLLGSLSEILGVNIEKILMGSLDQNETNGGNMKQLNFYLCPGCSNMVTTTGETEVSCCGRKLTVLKPLPLDEHHSLSVENIEDDLYITFDHPMNKSHYICFAAYVSDDRLFLKKLYPEQGGETRLPNLYGGKIVICCSRHGLYALEIKRLRRYS